ncbi:hypothetical protein EV659_104204 [Rhodothalassium salexigens DSM 2132]|uniref:Lysylphosphatidylglycerol synthase-like protein n=1 Tax=Rhodothalassium salexigens DSM 2132 TaxID=1188247 RepID=A0A4R2PIN1_RHOSA|nr:hypothetical protein [Rhodothalassium salexigens]MBB4211432.1 hypothetical protein [Rhodothalassium salexigens DSM 2132]MBK1637763.1 hypothetical protein [Rhodothalassium salexigens DSM 2132]TCP35352.1 hypothetical protein EV659_104204 [Rhodothalassium salexigens DSM 2132]
MGTAWASLWARGRQVAGRARAWTPPAWVGRTVKAALFCAVLALLVHQLWGVGFEAVLADTPASPWFYLLFAVRYAAFSGFEIAIYGHLFGRPLWRAWPVFLRKRVLNFAVVDYSGEAYFYHWARRELGDARPGGLPVFALVKDVNILSSAAAMIATLALLAAVAATGQLSRALDAAPGLEGTLAWAAAAAALLLALFLVFRGRVLSIPAAAARRVFALHGARLAVVSGLQVAQWALVLPLVDWSTWGVFLALYMAMTRLPLVPAKELAFAAVAVALAGAVAAPDSAVSALFLVNGVLMQATNLGLFALTGLTGSGRIAGTPGEPVSAGPLDSGGKFGH